MNAYALYALLLSSSGCFCVAQAVEATAGRHPYYPRPAESRWAIPNPAMARRAMATAPMPTTSTTKPKGVPPTATTECARNCTFTAIMQNWGFWTQCRTMPTAVIGQIYYLVDNSTNQTTTSTSYAKRVTYESSGTMITSAVSDILANGSQILTREDVNAAGTVTAQIRNSTFAYPTTHQIYSSEYKWEGIFPYTSDGVGKCVTGVLSEGTPLPSHPPMSTELPPAPDPQDPLGWTYCYQGSEYGPVDDSLYSSFSDNLVYALSNESNCKQVSFAAAPAFGVSQASFLLETTTAFVANSETSSATTATSSAAKKTAVDVDPIQISSSIGNAQASSQQLATDSSTSKERSVSSSPIVQSFIGPSSVDPSQTVRTATDLASVILSSSQSATESSSLPPGNSILTSNSITTGGQPLSTVVPDHQTDEPKATSEASQHRDTATSTEAGVILVSIIQDLGGQSSVPRSELGQAVTTPSTSAPTSPAPIPIGSTTITADPSGLYIIGTHTIQPGGTPYEFRGTTYSLATSASETVLVVVNGISSYAPESSTPTVTTHPIIAVGGITATADSASRYILGSQTVVPGGPAITVSNTRISIASDASAVFVGTVTSQLVSTTGMGAYVWAGIAGALSAMSDTPTMATVMPNDEAMDSTSELLLGSSGDNRPTTNSQVRFGSLTSGLSSMPITTDTQAPVPTATPGDGFATPPASPSSSDAPLAQLSAASIEHGPSSVTGYCSWMVFLLLAIRQL